MDARAEERRRNRIRRLNQIRIAIFIVVVVLFVVVTMSIKNVFDLTLEQHELKKENEDLKEQKAALEREFENINDKNYIEEQAREQLNMVKPGEIVYIVEEDDGSKNEKDNKDKKKEKKDSKKKKDKKEEKSDN
jgi:cell division protein FtsL